LFGCSSYAGHAAILYPNTLFGCSIAAWPSYFCSPCLERLPYALQTHNFQSFVDCKLESYESQLSEAQTTNQKLSETIEKVESQLTDNRKSLENMITDQVSDKAESPSKSPSISEDSVAQIAFSLPQNKKKRRNAN